MQLLQWTQQMRKKKKGNLRNVETCKIVSSSHKALLCDGCSQWPHTSCEGVKDEVCDILSGHDEDHGIHWYCKKCALLHKMMFSAVMKIDEAQKKLEEKVDIIMIKMTNKNLEAETIQECVEGALRVQLSEDKEEEKIKRKASVLVHGIEESKAMESMDRVGDDKGKIASILQEIDCGDAVIKQVIRLGKRQDGADAEAGPIKLVLEKEEAEQNLVQET